MLNRILSLFKKSKEPEPEPEVDPKLTDLTQDLELSFTMTQSFLDNLSISDKDAVKVKALLANFNVKVFPEINQIFSSYLKNTQTPIDRALLAQKDKLTTLSERDYLHYLQYVSAIHRDLEPHIMQWAQLQIASVLMDEKVN